MVKILMGFGRTGFQDWWIQRLTAVYMLVFWVALEAYYYLGMEHSYESWQALFSCSITRWFTLLFIVSVLAHAWIGLWTVTTDYIKVTFLRILAQSLINLILVTEFIWSVKILFF
jgi:succinate dehydrogenase / fumarate reductase membrane anchor subunit